MMTRTEIETFIFDTLNGVKDEVEYEAAIRKIAERWEDDIESAHDEGVKNGSFAEWSRTSGGTFGS